MKNVSKDWRHSKDSQSLGQDLAHSKDSQSLVQDLAHSKDSQSLGQDLAQSKDLAHKSELIASLCHHLGDNSSKRLTNHEASLKNEGTFLNLYYGTS
jgi:hypothetical protein